MYPMNDFYFRNYQQPQIKTYFVTNIEEARASIIDPLATNLFIDTSTGNIYLKKLGNDGRPQFLVYTIQEEAVKDPMEEIKTRLTNIENQLGGKNESISNDVKSATVSRTAVTEPYAANDEVKSTGIPKDAGNDEWEK